MKLFVQKAAFFWGLFMLSVLLVMCLPATPRVSKSLLFANIKKDSLLEYTKSPRIIFVGGSNLSFGLDSQSIKDSLNKNPINTAVHASLSLKYMMDNSLKYIRKGDVVILVPEYMHFYKDYNCGSEELLRTIFDVNISKLSLLSISQMINIAPYVPKFVISRLKFSEYHSIAEDSVYSVNSFNKYGDVFLNLRQKKKNFEVSNEIKLENYNPKVIEKIKVFRSEIKKKGATLLISYPGFQDLSFIREIKGIKKIEAEYVKNNFIILGTPERYKFPSAMMFDTPYHLNEKGAFCRTKLLIEDLKKVYF